MNNSKNTIAITMGDFNGIGPEVLIKSLNSLDINDYNILIIGSKNIFDFYSSNYNLALNKDYELIDIPIEGDIEVGKETRASGEFSYKCLIKACELARNGLVSSIVTAPVSKNALHLAGHIYSGQTEILEKELARNKDKAEMLFVARDFRVLLLTRHLPLNQVKITKDLLVEKIIRLNNVLVNKFSISSPKIALCSLNPHAGENGILGMEEIEEFYPAIEELRKIGLNISNPLPADTLFAKSVKPFVNKEKQPYDCYCACYHDQGLIPIKVLAMDETVNMTIGLSVIRTSPAHGTAFDIAGKNIADESSMSSAIKQVML